MTAWPTQKIDTTHLDQGSDSPAHARAAIKAMADTINAMIDAFGDPNGVATLDAAGLHPFRQMRGEVFTATERTRLANLSERTAPPRPAPDAHAPANAARAQDLHLARARGRDPRARAVAGRQRRRRRRLYLDLVRQGRWSTLRETYSGGDGGFIYFEIAVTPGKSYSVSVGGNGADGARSRDGADGGETALRGDFGPAGTLTLGTARGGKGGRGAGGQGRNGVDGTDGADGTSAAVWAFSQSSVSRQVQLVVPSPVSAGYVVIEWG